MDVTRLFLGHEHLLVVHHGVHLGLLEVLLDLGYLHH